MVHGIPTTAFIILRQALALNPKVVPPQRILFSLRQVQDKAYAISALNDLVKDEAHRSGAAFALLGNLYFEKERFAEAVDAFTKALEIGLIDEERENHIRDLIAIAETMAESSTANRN